MRQYNWTFVNNSSRAVIVAVSSAHGCQNWLIRAERQCHVTLREGEKVVAIFDLRDKTLLHYESLIITGNGTYVIPLSEGISEETATTQALC